jgi:hypothetical protein
MNTDCQKALSLRRVKDGMGKNPRYHCPGIGQAAKRHRQASVISGLNRQARRVVAGIIALSDGIDAIAHILMAGR